MFAPERRPKCLREMLHADEVDHHGTRPVGGVRTEQRLDRMNVASVVYQTVEFTDLGENEAGGRIDGGSLAEVTRHGK